MNRDTLYSLAVVDISDGATVTVPDAGDRYLSLMVINQDHYINRIFTEPGTYELTVEEFDTPWVALGARVLVDASNTDDVAEVNKIQDGFGIAARSSESFVPPDYDEASFTATRQTWLAEAAKGMAGTHGMFGPTSRASSVSSRPLAAHQCEPARSQQRPGRLQQGVSVLVSVGRIRQVPTPRLARHSLRRPPVLTAARWSLIFSLAVSSGVPPDRGQSRSLSAAVTVFKWISRSYDSPSATGKSGVG
jgi:hypothetical protein